MDENKIEDFILDQTSELLKRKNELLESLDEKSGSFQNNEIIQNEDIFRNNFDNPWKYALKEAVNIYILFIIKN